MIVYKYIPCSKRHLKALKKHQFWMSLPERLNDPFDCDHSIETAMPHEERLRVIAKRGECNTDELLDHPEITEILIKEHGASYLKEKLSKIGVCCFSSCWRSVAMWSHYADSHRGICLGYDAQDLDGTTGYSFDSVKYQDDPPQIHIRDVADEFDEAIHRYIFTKKTEWDREKEWRLVRLLGGEGLVESPRSLCSVIFGIRTSPRDRRRIWNILRDKDVSFFKLEQKKGTFGLEMIGYEGESRTSLIKKMIRGIVCNRF